MALSAWRRVEGERASGTRRRSSSKKFRYSRFFAASSDSLNRAPLSMFVIA
jgi:hypothetical protein